MSFQINSIVKIKTVGSIKVPRHEGPVKSLNNRDDFSKMPVPSEITGKIERIENGKYYVRIGDYFNGDFRPHDKNLMTFTQIYMSRFARLLG